MRRFALSIVLVVSSMVCADDEDFFEASERALSNVQADEGFEFIDRTDAAFIARGRHVARTRGCFGCHGQQLEGQVFEHWDWVDVAVAPNLASFARQHDAATIEAAIRQGIGHDGKALWSMPSYNWALLSDDDVSALIAYLKSAPVVASELPKAVLGDEARRLLAAGEAQHMAEWADNMPPLELGDGDDPQLVRGEYLAKTTCNECHGFDLRGWGLPEGDAPDLAIVEAYSDEQFRHLMKTGEAIGGRDDLELMSMIARDRFAYLSDNELADLLAYLRTLPTRPVDRNAAWRRLQ